MDKELLEKLAELLEAEDAGMLNEDIPSYDYDEMAKKIVATFKEAGWERPVIYDLPSIDRFGEPVDLNETKETLVLANDKAWELCVICSKPVSDGHLHEGDFMTGQEFYDRFEKELEAIGANDKVRSMNGIIVKNCARRAADLKGSEG
jgi:hypothetical protein